MDEGFEKLKIRWRELMVKGDKSEADKLYWEKMFPFIEEKFVRETQERMKIGEVPQYDLLIIPMGLESSYYILLINALKPKEIYFLCTKEGERYFLDKVIKMAGLTQDRYKKDIIEYEGMNAAEVYEKIKNKISMLKGKRIAVDLTRGSRVMAAGAAIVGDFFGCDLIHIDEGWYDDIKRGEPGTEKLTNVKNPLHIFGELEQSYAIELFNRYQYVAANLLFRDIINKVPDPREFEIKSLISECYMFWDSFNYRAALQILERVVYKINQYSIRTIDSEQLKRNLTFLKRLNDAQSSKKRFIEVLKDDDSVVHLLIDIFCNAERRAEQNKFEDSISRFYRAIELVSQHRLAKRDIDSTDPKYEKLGIDVSNEFRKITKEIYQAEKGLPSYIGLMDGHIILFAIKDDIWKNKSIEDLKKLHETIKLRDYSFVAHGIQIVNEDIYRNLKYNLKELLQSLCKLYNIDFNSLVRYDRFLKL